MMKYTSFAGTQPHTKNKRHTGTLSLRGIFVDNQRGSNTLSFATCQIRNYVILAEAEVANLLTSAFMRLTIQPNLNNQGVVCIENAP